MKWQMWRLTNVTPGVEIPSDIYELYDHFNAYRAEIIDGATYIENMLDAVLCDALAGKDEARRNRIQTTVLSGEFFTFFQKWKALRMLSKEDQYWFVEDIPKISECLKDLKDAINDRNKFAHGTIVIDQEKMKVVLRYNESGQQEVVIDKEMMERAISRMKSVYSWLEYLHLRFQTAP